MKAEDFTTIADRVKQIRVQKNYSQDYLAKCLGLTQKAYSKIENNETKLTVDALQRIANALETPIYQFFEESSRPVLNDFSSRTGGDNVIYKNSSLQEYEAIYKDLILAKDEIIKSKQSEIDLLKRMHSIK